MSAYLVSIPQAESASAWAYRATNFLTAPLIIDGAVDGLLCDIRSKFTLVNTQQPLTRALWQIEAFFSPFAPAAGPDFGIVFVVIMDPDRSVGKRLGPFLLC